MQPTTYVMDPAIQNNQTAGQVAKHALSSHTHNHGQNLPTGSQQVYSNQAYGSNIQPGYGPTTTTTTVTKEVDTYAQQQPIHTAPMMSQPMSTGTYHQHQELDKHGKPKKVKKEKKAKKEKRSKHTEQVIVPPGPAIVPAVVIPVIGAPPQNSAFVNPGMYQQGQFQQPQYQQGFQQGPMYQHGPVPAPTSGVLPPTGVQNPMTATLPINQQGLNPTSYVGHSNLAVQPPILSTAGRDLEDTKHMISHQHPSGVSGNNSYSTYNSGYQQPGHLDATVKQTYVEERKEVIGGPTVAHRQF